MKRGSHGAVAFMLFCSGLCALTYQIVWQREFRYIFGSSTAASAAVLAIFIGGLGAGGLLLGRVADRHSRPLRLYARLEACIALSAALTPLLFWLIRTLYLTVGGTQALGTVLGTVVRLVLAALVLAVPTILMGGTLPALARAVESADDAGRRRLALLYGINTLGAVTGSALSTFVLLEIFGNRLTLFLAILVNLAVAILANTLSRHAAPEPLSVPVPVPVPEDAPIPRAFTLTAALLVGFAFFVMEIVWYRLLGPLLGGTVFSFGLILCVALTGIGIGGALYGLRDPRRPATVRGFALTCLLEALFLILPFAFADDIAILSLVLRPLEAFGFAGHVTAWLIVSGILILPAAAVSGIQFPMLIALLGRGRENVGQQVGLAYASNTTGSLLGALAGGFLLLPGLGAPLLWCVAAWLLAATGATAAVLAVKQTGRPAFLLPATALVAAILLCTTAVGPTAVFRHSQIGVGRVSTRVTATPTDLRAFEEATRGAIHWQTDGIESSVALNTESGMGFVVNGKVDGHVFGDAGTQLMVGLVGAILHPNPKRAMVIGLGTGCTAGWLAADPRIERVDVAELEPALIDVARRLAPFNHDVVNNPRAHILTGDARELLQTGGTRYDLIASEPSNPYRAGIASLYTREFYHHVKDHLADDGIFMQWTQAYDIDLDTLFSIYKTLGTVFPHIETFELSPDDLLMVASQKPIVWDEARLRATLATEPFRSALWAAWRAPGLEGFLSHYVARADLAALAAARSDSDGVITDDHTFIEFGFARTVGRRAEQMEGLRRVAAMRGWDRPEIANVDWPRVEALRAAIRAEAGTKPYASGGLRIDAGRAFVAGDRAGALALFEQQPGPPIAAVELRLVAEGLAERGDQRATAAIDALRALDPIAGDVALVRLHLQQKRPTEAGLLLLDVFERTRGPDWPSALAVGDAFKLSERAALADRALATQIFSALEQPFPGFLEERARRTARVRIGEALGPEFCTRALLDAEPHPQWNLNSLRVRRDCYKKSGHALAAQAEDDYAEARAAAPDSMTTELDFFEDEAIKGPHVGR